MAFHDLKRDGEADLVVVRDAGPLTIDADDVTDSFRRPGGQGNAGMGRASTYCGLVRASEVDAAFDGLVDPTSVTAESQDATIRPHSPIDFGPIGGFGCRGIP